jgi:cytochrome c peroxidase
MKKIIIYLLFLIIFTSCRKSDSSLEDEPIKFYIPEGFPQASYNFNNNPLTQKGFELGRKLFYDPILSKDNSISCGNCHQQYVAFAHAEHKLSHGINGLLGTRNSPALFNIAWQNEFFWDGGSNNIEVQPIGPITNPVEMDESIANVILKLKNSSVYPVLFKSAFGTDTITSQRMLKALAQFMNAMISADSKYDNYRNGTATFTSSELSGLALFRQHCEACHKEPLFSDFKYRNNGLDSQFLRDPGRARITLDPQDSGKFKVPSLRNIDLTGPYMHDGRFSTLSKVIDHYLNGIQQSSTLDPILATGFTLNAQEKSDLLSFLSTLTDNKFISDKRFSEIQ